MKRFEGRTVKNEYYSILTVPEDKLIIVGASAAGKSHLQDQTPCQDAFSFDLLRNKWGFVVVADGAGSVLNSQIGSNMLVRHILPELIHSMIHQLNWDRDNIVPSQDEWKKVANALLSKALENLKSYSMVEGIDINDLSCTVMVVIFSPKVLLCSHIGDGRVGYCNENNEWKHVMKPHKGEEANQTIFITSSYWQDSELRISGIEVPENTIIEDNIRALVLLSDGCEKHSFICSVFDYDNNIWSDPNTPFPLFFNPIVNHLKATNENDFIEVIANDWFGFLIDGNQKLKDERDDKTMVVCVISD